ncbi:hypothetical protein V6N13_124269 [Hibiscus sabdariffa]
MVRSEVVPPTLVGLQDAQSISADTQTIMTPVIQPATSVGVDQVSPNVPVDNSPRFASQELGSGGAEPQRSNAHSTDIGVLEPNCSVRSEAQQGNNPVGSTSNDVGPSYVELNTKNSHTMLMRSKMSIFKPKVYSAVTSVNEKVPDTVYQAMQSEEWKEVIQAEYAALVNNGTWVLVELP